MVETRGSDNQVEDSGEDEATKADVAELRVFISHRHDDRAFAGIIADKLRDWGFKTENVFVSSDVRSGVPAGKSIENEVKEKVHTCDLLIHIFTRSSANWEWVGREIGYAEARENPPHIITFQIFDDEPSIRPDRMRVTLVKDEIYRFVRSLFTDRNFFPGRAPVSPIPKRQGHEKRQLEEFLQNEGLKLYQSLSDIASQRSTADLQPVNQEQTELNVYISCRGADSGFGDKLKDQLEEWKTLWWKGLNVQMSPLGNSPGNATVALDDVIVDYLWKCHLVILIFSEAAGADWVRCGMEIGTANDPRVQPQVIILRILDAPPTNEIPDNMRHSVIDTHNNSEMTPCRPNTKY